MKPGLMLVTGNRGSFKSALTCDMAIEEFCSGSKRSLVPGPGFGFNRKGFADAMRHYGKPPEWAYQRCVVLQPKEALFFWRYRLVNGKLLCKPLLTVESLRYAELCKDIIESNKSKTKLSAGASKEIVAARRFLENPVGKADDYGHRDWLPVDYTGDPGQFYILDEIADIFTAKHWQSTCDEFRHYCELFRRLNDVVLGSCIDKSDVLVDVRDLLDTHVEMQDMATLRKWGIALSSKYTGHVFVGKDAKADPKASGSNRWINAKIHKRPDPIVFGCYDTTQGPGMIGGAGDKIHVRPWLTWKKLVPVFGLALIAAGFLFNRGCESYMDKLSGRSPEPAAVVVPAVPTAVLPEPAVKPVPAPVKLLVTPAAPIPRYKARQERIEAVSTVGGGHVFTLSDGRVLRNPAGVWDERTGRLLLDNGDLYEVGN